MKLRTRAFVPRVGAPGPAAEVPVWSAAQRDMLGRAAVAGLLGVPATARAVWVAVCFGVVLYLTWRCLLKKGVMELVQAVGSRTVLCLNAPVISVHREGSGHLEILSTLNTD